MTPRKQNYSVQATSTTTCLTPLNTTLNIAPVELHKTKQLPPAGKEYLCFQINRRTSHASQCVKSRIANNFIDSTLSIDTYEQRFVVIKVMLQSPCLDNHMNTIGVDQSLCKRSSFEHKFLKNIKKIYQHVGKCDNQQNLKYIIDSAMVSTTEEFTDDIQSCVTPRKQKYSVQDTSTTTCLTSLNATQPIAPVELHTTKQLPCAGKEYLFSRLTVDLLMLPSVSNHG